jgi:post-segregation antitoxin (ccd killing protein)
VDITVYLPDEVAQRAKAQNVNLSRVLRDALTAQFTEEDAVSATLEEARTVTLDLQTDEGRAYRGRMEATLLGEAADGATAVYVRRSGEVIAYRAKDRAFRAVEDPASELFAVLPADRYFAAMDALGIVPEIDLDAPAAGAASAAQAPQPPPKTAGRRLRSVPGDIVEPPVAFLKRLTGHGEAAKVNAGAAELSTEGAGPEASSEPDERAAEAPADVPVPEASPEPESSAT